MLRFLRYMGLALAGLVAAALVARYGSGVDPFDRFLVVAVLSDPASGQHAVTYRYHHADSSSEVYAVWIGRDAPSIGSQAPVRWRLPVLVWKMGENAPTLSWADARLRAAFPSGVKVSPNRNDCYFEHAQTNLVCADAAAVDLATR